MLPSDPHNYVPHGLDVLRTYGEGFAGRAAELEALDRAWDEGAVRVFVLHAEGGAGKTRVVAKWLTQMRDAGWRGAGRVFVHSFYSQGSDERRNASSEFFFEQALDHFGHTGPRLNDPTEQGRTLARLLIDHRGILVLDGIEPLQHPPPFDQGRLKDPALYSLFRSLAAGRLGDLSSGGLCVVTSRQPVVELQDKIGRAVVQQPLDRLDIAAGVELLRQLEVRGPDRELREAVEDARGHAYSLMLLGSYLRDATDDHEIRRRKVISLLEEDEEHRYHARHLFGAYVEHLGESSSEVAVLRLLSFFDRPADEKLLAVLREAEELELTVLTAQLRSLSSDEWRRILRRLTVLRLIDISTSPFPPIDSHPLLREYFAEQLRTRFPEAWKAGHQRLFEHLCKTTIKYQPDTLAGLQPLYQAVAHGCLAGLHRQACEEVYHDRILRGGEAYSLKKLGAFGADLGAVACFFATPWTTLAPNFAPSNHAWLLGEAAFRLRALGRLTEAVEPMQVAMEMGVKVEAWNFVTQVASNLSEIELIRGEVALAIALSEQSVIYADLAGNTFVQMTARVRQADTLHQVGQRAESRRLFEDAELRQAADQQEYPRLYSVQGFMYCDFLLANAERSAWQRCLLALPAGRVDLPSQGSLRNVNMGAIPVTQIAVCTAVRKRAAYALKIAASNRWLLDIAADHLTLARATLYASLSPQTAVDHITAAVQGFREAGLSDHLTRGLLTRAWLRCLAGDELGCWADLDEAWEIAERGPMPLFQADLQLYRARLFQDRTALAEARRLIDKHGYHRRDGELADAEAAAKAQGWGEPQATYTQPIETPQPAVELKLGENYMRDQVFISYSHRDEKLMEELLTHLKPYLRSGAVTAWSDKQIASGSKWFEEIQTALGRTSVAVLLVSPSFLASDFIHEHELGPLLKEAEAGGVKILWVQLRSSSYEETPLKDYQAVVSPPEKPLAKMGAERDDAWVRVCKEIKKAVKP